MTELCCPFCKGTQGYGFIAIEEWKYEARWGEDDFEESSSESIEVPIIPVCLDCGKHVRVSELIPFFLTMYRG